jgi:hypothetical protein
VKNMRLVLQDVRIVDVFRILLVTIMGMLLLIANPGYYSHDELQKLDHIEKFGFLHYLSSYVVLVQGDGFGTPVRPFSFIVLGVIALVMRDYPVIVHLVDVLTHGAVAVLLFIVLLRFRLPRVVALVSACIFALNPMAVIAVGWPAALMDRWYVLFGIGALLFAESHVRGRSGVAALGFVSCFVLAAILSKETAIMLPGLMLIFVLIDASVLSSRRFWQAGAAMTLPVVAYLLYRLPAIVSSFGGNQGGGGYSASTANISDGLMVYLAYPVLFNLTEAVNWVFISPWLIGAAVAVHLVVVAVLWLVKGWRISCGYLFFYLLFLVPVLFISIKAAHYLYASSIFFSTAVAWLIVVPSSRFALLRLFGVLVLAMTLVHTVFLQIFVYRLGSCMDTAMTSVEAVHMTLGRPPLLEMRAEPGAPAHVLHRFATGRDKVGESYPVNMKVVQWDAHRPVGQPVLVMDRQCRIHALK